MLKGKKNVNKTVKHCAVCQEDFGDRFSFCPVCGESLQAVDENINQETAVRASTNGTHSENLTAADVNGNGNVHREENEPAVVPVTAPLVSATAVTTPLTPSVAEAVPVTATEPVSSDSHSFLHLEEIQRRRALKRAGGKFGHVHTGKGEYHLTMIQPPKSYGRLLTSGAILGLFLMMSFVIGLFIYDIFAFPLDVAAIDDQVIVYPAYLSDEKPEPEEKIERKDPDKGGGGGGGGNNDPKPPSKGVDAAQMKADPVIRPSVNAYQNDNFELKQQATTVGNQPKTEEGPYGIKSSTSTDPSDGPGRGGGQGTGIGGGQGSGDGTGKGTGRGSGSGGGDGDGNGNGRGDGDNVGGAPPPRPKGPPLEPLKILSQPKPGYTEEARKNNITGSVRLRVTFSASGTITSITPVSGLPYGLTEQAIAAARRMQFIPEKRNGVPVSKTRVVEYGFNIY
jgi:TonB family protein